MILMMIFFLFKNILAEIIEKLHLELHLGCISITHQGVLHEIICDGPEFLDSNNRR